MRAAKTLAVADCYPAQTAHFSIPVIGQQGQQRLNLQHSGRFASGPEKSEIKLQKVFDRICGGA
jgi:hypothetical protein